MCLAAVGFFGGTAILAVFQSTGHLTAGAGSPSTGHLTAGLEARPQDTLRRGWKLVPRQSTGRLTVGAEKPLPR